MKCLCLFVGLLPLFVLIQTSGADNIDEISDENRFILRDFADDLVQIVDKNFKAVSPRDEDFDAHMETYVIIDRIIGVVVNRIISPIVGILNERLDKLRELIGSRVDNAKEKINKLINSITELLRPHVVRIMDILNNMGVEMGEIKEKIKMTLLILVDHVKAITEVNKQIIRDFIDFFVSSLLGESTTYRFSAVAAPQPYIISSIIRPIFNRLIRPIVDKLNARLANIREAIKNQTANIKEIIEQQVTEIAELLRPIMIRIINILNDFGVQIKDLGATIKETIISMIDTIDLITEENKKLMKSLLTHVVRILLKKLEDDTYLAQRFIWEPVIKPIIKVVTEQIKSIAKAITDQGSNISDAVKQHIDNLVAVLRPIISRLLPNISGNPTGAVGKIARVIGYIFRLVGEIPGVSRDTIVTIIDYISKVLAGEIAPTVSTITYY